MKTIIATTALALSLAAPALAQGQLAAGVGVDAGDYTTAELVRLNQAIEADDHAYVAFLTGSSANAVDAEAARAFAVQAAAEDDNLPLADFLADGGSEVISSQSYGASDAARAFAIEQAAEDNNWNLVRFLEAGGSLN